MTVIALCKVAPAAPNLSDVLRADQARYVDQHAGEALLIADLHTHDAPIEGDDYRQALLVIAEGEVAAVKAAITGAPYFAAGLWRRVEFYTTTGLLGAWSDGHAAQFERMKGHVPEPDMLPPLASGGRFAVISTFADQAVGPEQGAGHLRNSARIFKRLLVAAPLEFAEAVGAESAAPPHRSIYLYQGDDIGDVRAMTGQDPLTRDGLWTLRIFDVAGLTGRLPPLPEKQS